MAKVIMIQGTMSGVGKSLLAAGLCRIFKQDGYRTAPFKSQNMALNSFVTKEGLEMGRAQVLQAQAAGAEPVAAMNPILLKPVSDMGSQVIVNGEVRGNMRAQEYFRYKKELIPEILAAYRKLEAQYDIIVIEGAGSPAEINLKDDDIVNMGLAEMVDAPVLLAGDIDRGGVFAQLLGTLMLLEDAEKRRVKGLIVNKFRGDESILEPGIRMLEARAGVPVLGTVPYMRLDLEEEDSLSERFSRRERKGLLDIAVVRLPKISNYTDFLALEESGTAGVRYVERPEGLGKPDLVILPGTKNTMGDLKWLRESGMEAAIVRLKNDGCVIFGICGGFQMLGQTLRDPEHVEEGGTMRGMGFLPMETVFDKRKVRTRAAGHFGKVEGALSGLSGEPVEGYEIHMGSSYMVSDAQGERGRAEAFMLNPAERAAEAENSGAGRLVLNPAERETKTENSEAGQFILYLTDSISKEKKQDGMQAGNVYGTYLHGIFDRAEVREALLKALAEKKGIVLEKQQEIPLAEYRERQFDILADGMRRALDMERIYAVLNGTM